MTLPLGCKRLQLSPHLDERGSLVELFREEWDLGVSPVQWNLVHSEPHTLRGFHVHLKNYDYLCVISGSMDLRLVDLRKDSPTFGDGFNLLLQASSPEAVVVPPGVGHAFYFSEGASHIYGLSEHWSRAHHIGCRWDDPDLGLGWSIKNPLLSDQDQSAPSLKEIKPVLDARAFDLAARQEH